MNFSRVFLVLMALNLIIINEIYSQDISSIDEKLKTFNKSKYSLVNDTINNTKGKAFKILIIGNSLTYHYASDSIGWNHSSGMAASNLKNDFAHLLFEKTEKLLPKLKIAMRVINLAVFERNFLTYNFKLLDKLVNRPDLIIFQLGENVVFDKTNTQQKFEDKYVELIKYIKKGKRPIVICTTPFFPSLEKNNIINKVAYRCNSYVADLSQLTLLNKNNYAYSDKEYSVNRNKWKAKGIEMHPGNLGMANIAQQIFVIINAAINLREIN